MNEEEKNEDEQYREDVKTLLGYIWLGVTWVFQIFLFVFRIFAYIKCNPLGVLVTLATFFEFLKWLGILS